MLLAACEECVRPATRMSGVLPGSLTATGHNSIFPSSALRMYQQTPPFLMKLAERWSPAPCVNQLNCVLLHVQRLSRKPSHFIREAAALTLSSSALHNPPITYSIYTLIEKSQGRRVFRCFLRLLRFVAAVKCPTSLLQYCNVHIQ